MMGCYCLYCFCIDWFGVFGLGGGFVELAFGLGFAWVVCLNLFVVRERVDCLCICRVILAFEVCLG